MECEKNVIFTGIRWIYYFSLGIFGLLNIFSGQKVAHMYIGNNEAILEKCLCKKMEKYINT